MDVETNQFIENLKEILFQFELPANKLESEVVRLERLRLRLKSQGTTIINERNNDTSQALYMHGLTIFKERYDEVG